MKWNKQEWDRAIKLLSEVAEYEASCIEYEIESTTTNSWEEFKKETEKNGYITVSMDGCDTSIYDNAVVNRMARVWHDKVHLNNNLSFSLKDEIEVTKIQQEDIYDYVKEVKLKDNQDFNIKILELAQKIIYIDVAEQLKYYYKHKKFVENQKTFVQNILYNEG